MSLQPEKINQIKQIIHNRFSELDIQSKIRDIVEEKLRDNEKSMTKSNNQRLTQDLLIQELKKKGVVDSIMSGMQFQPNVSSSQKHHSTAVQSTHRANMRSSNELNPILKTTPNFVDKNLEFAIPLNKVNIDPNRRHLYFQVICGRAFLEYINDEEPIPGVQQPLFTLFIHFRGQRFKSRSFPCACEPRIEEGFLIELHKEKHGESGMMADRETLLSVCDPLHIVLIRTDMNGDTNLVSSNFLEWRTVLACGNNKQNVSIELMGTGSESKVPAGILQACIQLLPMLEDSLRDDVLSAQMGLEYSRNTERERLFLVYAKQWWKEFLEIRDDHKSRLVKIFAQDENGVNKPVCSYVRPMRTARLIDTPRQAARFVSLIGYNKLSPTLGINEQTEQWLHLHTFLAKNRGDSENHSILLCNLLLGFGLNAFVCIGTKTKNQTHAWVVTISSDYEEVIFWESLTGNRYIHKYVNPDDAPLDKNIAIKHPYKTVGCAFNHKAFYANVQPTCNVDTCSFSLKEQNKWKAMSEDTISSVCDPMLLSNIPFTPPLCQNTIDPILVSNDLERQLRALTVEHRKELGLATSWDDNLSYILNPALSSYEMERVTGFSVGNEEFDQAVKLAIPDGHTFKAFPIQFIHKNARKAFASCLKSPICEEILCCRGDQVKIALRVRVFAYPESAMATWVMFACRYKVIV